MPTLPMFRPEGQTIAELLMRQGDIAGRAAMARGAAWGNAIAGVGQAAADAYGQYAERKDQKKREAMLDAAMSSFDPQKPMDFYRLVAPAVGPAVAMKTTATMLEVFKAQRGAQPDPKVIVGGLMGLEESTPGYLGKNWGQIRPQLEPIAKGFGVPVPEDPAEIKPWLQGLYRGLNPATKPGTRQVAVKNADGSETIKIVEDVPGQAFESAVPPAKPENLTGEEAYIRALYGEKPTPQQMLEGRARYAAAGREPTKPGTGVPSDTGRVIAQAWASGTSFPSTQDAKTAALLYMDAHPDEFPNRPRQLTAMQQDNVLRSTEALATIDDVWTAYQKVKQKVGPVKYAFNEWTRRIPGTESDPDFVAFNTLLRGMGNLEIKRITGAQMSEAEADRLLKGMATGTLKPGDFEAALKVMRRNAKRGRDVILYGKVLEESAPAGPTARFTAVNPKTGQRVEWDGKAWVPVK